MTDCTLSSGRSWDTQVYEIGETSCCWPHPSVRDGRAHSSFSTQVFAQVDVQSVVLKHVKTSRDFTLKVADQMPESDYAFRLTPPQMSFAEQMIHLTQGLDEFIAPFSGQKPNPAKPASMTKKDVMAFIQKSFDDAIAKVSKLTSAQLSKTYASEEGNMTGLELLMGNA